VPYLLSSALGIKIMLIQASCYGTGHAVDARMECKYSGTPKCKVCVVQNARGDHYNAAVPCVEPKTERAKQAMRALQNARDVYPRSSLVDWWVLHVAVRTAAVGPATPAAGHLLLNAGSKRSLNLGARLADAPLLGFEVTSFQDEVKQGPRSTQTTCRRVALFQRNTAADLVAGVTLLVYSHGTDKHQANGRISLVSRYDLLAGSGSVASMLHGHDCAPADQAIWFSDFMCTETMLGFRVPLSSEGQTLARSLVLGLQLQCDLRVPQEVPEEAWVARLCAEGLADPAGVHLASLTRAASPSPAKWDGFDMLLRCGVTDVSPKVRGEHGNVVELARAPPVASRAARLALLLSTSDAATAVLTSHTLMEIDIARPMNITVGSNSMHEAVIRVSFGMVKGDGHETPTAADAVMSLRLNRDSARLVCALRQLYDYAAAASAQFMLFDPASVPSDRDDSQRTVEYNLMEPSPDGAEGSGAVQQHAIHSPPGSSASAASAAPARAAAVRGSPGAHGRSRCINDVDPSVLMQTWTGSAVRHRTQKLPQTASADARSSHNE
jgi:hypothetical protein